MTQHSPISLGSLAIVFGCLLLISAGCTGPRVVTPETASDDPLAGRETFSLEVSTLNAPPEVNATAVFQQAVAAADAALRAAGLSPAEEGADLEVVVASYTNPAPNLPPAPEPVRHRVIREEAEYQSAAGGTIVRTTQPRVTTVVTDMPLVLEEPMRVFVVDLVDPRDGALLWRGFTRRDDTALSPAIIAEEIRFILGALPE